MHGSLHRPLLLSLLLTLLVGGSTACSKGGSRDPRLLMREAEALVAQNQYRAALELAQRAGRWVVVDGFARLGVHAHLDAALSMHFELVGTLRAGWTPLQAHYAAAVRRELAADGRGAQKRVAESEQVNPSVISESLKASHFDLVQRAEALLAELLREAAQVALTQPEPER